MADCPPRCGHKEAVFFQSHSARAEVSGRRKAFCVFQGWSSLGAGIPILGGGGTLTNGEGPFAYYFGVRLCWIEVLCCTLPWVQTLPNRAPFLPGRHALVLCVHGPTLWPPLDRVNYSLLCVINTVFCACISCLYLPLVGCVGCTFSRSMM